MSKTNKKNQNYKIKSLTLMVAALAFINTACDPKNEVKDLAYNSVGGHVSGMNGGTLILSNNGGEQVDITSDGEFTFPTELGATNRYQVEVARQPDGQTCSVANASGVMSVVEITDVTVVCSPITHTISATVTGMNGGTLVVQNNGGDNFTVPGDGTLTFSSVLAEGATYNVTVLSQPAGQTCTVTNGSGVASADISDITITCTH